MDRTVRAMLMVVLCALTVSVSAKNSSQRTAGTPGTLLLDLATMTPNGVTKRPGGRNATYEKILIINAIPRFRPYNIDIAIVDVAIPPLPLTAFGGSPPSGVGDRSGADDPCTTAIADLVARLDAVEVERDVPDIGAAARAAAPDVCKDAVSTKFTSLTQFTIEWPFTVRSNQTLTVTASRPGAVFTLQLPGTPRGEWRTSYGFFFVPDRDERYYVDETSTATATTPARFTIQEQADREEFDFVPTVVFTFFPNGAGEMNGVRGWTAGLGYDLEKPFVFGGYSYAYNENVIFTGGLTFHRQSRLLGKYKGNVEGEVTQQLEPSQLVEDTYAPNVYVGVSFRFGDDIHARRRALEEATARAQQAAAAATATAKAAQDEANIRKAECVARAEAAAAAAKAAADCKDNPLCVAKVEKEEAAAKAKCPLTELERVAAAKAEREKTAALEKAERRAACQTAAETANDAVVRKCTKDFDACKKTAKGAAAAKECEDTAALCKADAAAELAAAEARCLDQ